MILRKKLFLAMLFTLCAAMAFAQSGQSLILEFVDGNDLTVTYPNQTVYTMRSGAIQEGDAIPVGATIRTGTTTSAELRLSPNGTIVKLARSTTFKVEGLATPQDNQNGFTLVAGKIRTVAAKGSNYNVFTASTVAGVRGTDFSMAFEAGSKARLMVAKGAVEFGKLGAGGQIAERIMVGAGQFADLFSGFVAQQFTADQFATEYNDIAIDPVKLPPEPAAGQPGASGDATTEGTEAADGSGTPEASATADTGAATGGTEATTTGTASTAEGGSPAATGATGAVLSEAPAAAPGATTPSGRAPAAARTPSAMEAAIIKWIQEVLGMELGSITIGDTTYAKAIIQPTFNFGKLKMGLYLPIIYQSNLFDPNDWYMPKGNNEWSFGTQTGDDGLMLWESDPMSAAIDAAQDLALKIRYLEVGRPLIDPFFFKVGNLSSFTIGHGLLMRNYANDADFPAIRRLGLNIGVDFGKFGFEALTNDVLDNQIIGGRLFVRPIGKLAFGLSAAADLYPASIFNSSTDPDASKRLYGDPIFIGAAVDLDLPFITSDLLSLRLFADGAAMVPYLRSVPTAGTYKDMEQGLRYNMVYNDGQISNWGASAGLMGNILFIDWRLEYRYFTGAFRPAFFDASYDRRRASVVNEWMNYLNDPNAIQQTPSVMGVYGEGGFSILKEKLAFNMGYFWPWSAELGLDLADQIVSADDYFKASLVIKQGLIPVVDIAGSIVYERKQLVKAITGRTLSLFDENTIFSGEIIVPVPGAPNINLALMVSTAMDRADNGDIILVDNKPKIIPVVTLETRLRF
jgi:hypothetical protein